MTVQQTLHVHLDVALPLILNALCRYSAVTASQDMSASGILGFQWLSSLRLLQRRVEMGQTFLWHCPVHVYDRCMELYESPALLGRKQFLCLCTPNLLRLLLTEILLGFQHFLCQNLTAPMYFFKSCICIEFSGSSFSPCMQVVLRLCFTGQYLGQQLWILQCVPKGMFTCSF